MIRLRLFLLTFTAIFFTSCATKKHKDVTYLSNAVPKNISEPNVFTPRKKHTERLPVLIFIHGGNWNAGNKDTYGFFGRNFAKKSVVTVIPGYTLSPNASYDEMTKQIAEAVSWTKENIAEYGGDPSNIFLTGHSAGGHLAALAIMNPKYNIDQKDISGIILNDAAGLDMKHYLEENPPTSQDDYITTWTQNPENWQDASPVYYINKNTPPIMMYVGNKTYQSIKTANRSFLDELHKVQPDVEPIFLDKKHIPMMVQYFWPWSKRYREILGFINE